MDQLIEDANSIGSRIRQARKALGLSQADLALRIGVTQPAIANWESGVHDPRRVMMARLADALDASFDWIASGGRSAYETDKAAAAAYIRRPLQHVPVLSRVSAARFASNDKIDPHALAEDYLPVTASSTKLFAIIVESEAIDADFPKGAVVVVDYGDRVPLDGCYCLALVGGAPVIRRWRSSPPRLEAGDEKKSVALTGDVAVIGCVRVSIRIH